MSTDARVVVVGAGLAGVAVTEALRKEGHEGEIVVIGQEPHLPYDRPPLSKEVLRGAKGFDDVRLRTRESFDEAGVELRLGVEVIKVDQGSRLVHTDDGQTVTYDHLVIATGLQPRHLDGTEGRPRVHALRTWDDSVRLAAELESARRVLVIGAGFIGCEIAASLRDKELEVVLVEPNAVPLQPAVGPLVGELVARLHRDHGVDLRTGVGVAELDADELGIRARLSDGAEVLADLAVVGIGSSPRTQWLAGTDLDVSDGVLCDADGRTSDPAIWAVGDVSRRTPRGGGEPRRVEHWTSSREHGSGVARAILGLPHDGKPEPPEYVWSDQYGAKLQVLGRVGPHSTPHVLVEDGHAFVVAFEEDGRLVGAVGMGTARRLMALRKPLMAGADIHDVTDDLVAH